MKDLPTNSFLAGSQGYLAYRRAYVLASAYRRESYNAMCGRVLGYMLQELPWDEGRSKMASEVNSCADNQSLVHLGTFYINHFLRVFRSANGLTPAPSACPSFDDDRDMNSDIITAATQDHRSAKINALKRDGYRCMLSGRLDASTELELLDKIDAAALDSTAAHDAAVDSANAPFDYDLTKRAAELVKKSDKSNAAAQKATRFLANFPDATVVTNAVHIFPESTNANIDNDVKRDYASSVWAIMERFGQKGFRDELDGSKIHRLRNILTLDHRLHMYFDKLALWLEVDNALPHTYHICSKHDNIRKGLPRTVTFRSHNDAFGSSDLPDPRYLQMHAACCRVAHMSGVSGYLDGIMDDLEKGQTKVLSKDGSGSRILEFALLACIGGQITAF